MPVPYRERVHEYVAAELGDRYHVVYAIDREPDRQWKLKIGDYSHTFLRRAYIPFQGRVIHANYDIWPVLDAFKPDIVITAGFNPTHLLAFAWSRVHRARHIPFTDGWLKSERQRLTPLHVALRRYVYSRSDAFIGASQRSLELYRHYGAPDAALFQSHLCADNARFAAQPNRPREFDLLFSGQLKPRKLPMFFAQVAGILRRRRSDLSALILGDGPERHAMQSELSARGVRHHFAGFVEQAELPAQYARCRLMMFPTEDDAWGVVANEACAAGIPVITCSYAGSAGELVEHGKNGYVLPLDAPTWAMHAERLLDDESLRETFARNAIEKVSGYTYRIAAQGILSAAAYCERRRRMV